MGLVRPMNPQKHRANSLEKGFWRFLCSELNFLFLSQHVVQLANRHSLGELLPAA